jgi:hypothetical protein
MTSEKPTLFQTLEQKYPPQSIRENLMIFLKSKDNEHELKNWRQFAEAVSDYESKGQEPPMTVRKSSTWAVCQEFLGKLSNRDDLDYAETRDGVWCTKFSTEYIREAYKLGKKPSDKIATEKIITLRQILESFQENYPAN